MPGYRLVRRLGNGFSGTVWIARGAGGTEVALKIVELQKIGGRKELQALRTIRNVRHPNICEVHGFWVKDSSGRLLEDGESEAIIPQEGSLELGVLEPAYEEPNLDQTATSAGGLGLLENPGTEKSALDTLPTLPPLRKDPAESSLFETNIFGDDESESAEGDNPHTATILPEEHVLPEEDVLATQQSSSLEESAPARISGGSAGGPELDASATQGSGLEGSGRISSEQYRDSGSRGSGSATGTGGIRSKGRPRAAAEQLIIVMSLGDMTLHDRLTDVRKENKIHPKDRKTVCGLEAEEAIRYVRSSASAIDLLMQQHSIMHGDIKPQNILLVGGEAQVCDFGLANKLVEDILKTKHPFVSPAYGAPEVLDGTGYSKSADQYALAVTYFELRTGQFPFDHRTKASILKAKILDQFDLDHLLPAERIVIRKAMNSNPKDRFRTCTEFTNALAVAAGLEKSGGLNPKRVAIGGVVLATLILGIAYFLRPDTTKVATELLAKGNEQLELYAPDTKYIDARDPLRLAIFKLKEGLSNCEDGDQKKQFSVSIASACDGLCDEILEELETASADPKTPLQNRTLIKTDVDLMAQSGDASVQERLAMIQLQRSLLGVRADDDPQPVAEEVLQSVRQQIAAYDETTQAKRSKDEFIASAVGLAVSHGGDRPTDSDPSRSVVDFADPQRLDDLVRAERWLAKHGQESIPAWMAVRWNELRNGGQGFLTHLQSALTDNSTPEVTKATIRKNWPSLATEALLTELRADAENDRWQAFIDGQPEPADRSAGESSIQTKLDVFGDMAKTLAGRRTSIEMLQGIQGQLQDADPPTRGFLADSVVGWLRELAKRSRDHSQSKSFDRDEVESLHQASEAIASSLGQNLPIEFDQWLVAKTIEAGSLESVSDPVAAARRRLSLAGHPLAILFDSEQQALKGTPLDSVSRAKLNKTLARPGDWVALNSDFRSAYLAFQKGLSPWHAGNLDESLARFGELVAEDDNRAMTDALGNQRCVWVLNANVQRMLDRIGAGTDEFLLPEFSLSEQILDEPLAIAQQWRSRVNDPSDASTRTLTLLELAGLWPLSKWILDRLDTLADDTVQLTPQDRLLIRLAYEGSRQSAKDPSDASSRVPIKLQSASIMLDRGLGSRSATQPWIHEVLAPSLHTLLIHGDRNHEAPSGWTLERFINEQSAQRIAQHGERASENRLLEPELAQQAATEVDGLNDAGEPPIDFASGELLRIDAIEMCCAILATQTDLSPQERYRLLIEAADLFQQQMELRGLPWDLPRLKQFDKYIKDADESVPDTPAAAILNAFGRYHQAFSLLADGAEISSMLESAAKALKIAINRIVKQPPTELVYKACWRHANLLTNLAFRQSGNEKKETLKQARSRAKQAVDMLSKLSPTTTSNPAYLAMGNACEDLAFYCERGNSKEQRKYFDEAIKNFKFAVANTQHGGSLRPRYCLARCRFRYYVMGTGGRAELAKAEQALGEPDTNASNTSQVEWHSWKSMILAELEETDDALDQAHKAHDLLSDHSGKQQSNEVTLLLATRLAASDSVSEWEDALEYVLKVDASPGSKTKWESHVLKCRLYHKLQRYQEFADTLVSLDVKDVDKQLGRSAPDVMKQVADLTFQLVSMAFPKGFGDAPELDSAKASKCIKYLQNVLKLSNENIRGDESFIVYAAIVNASLNADPSKSLSNNVAAYTVALDKFEILKSKRPNSVRTVIGNDARRALLRLFRYYIYAAQRNEAGIQFVKELRGLNDGLRDRMKQEMDTLRNSGELLSEEERTAIKSLRRYFDGIQPVAKP